MTLRDFFTKVRNTDFEKVRFNFYSVGNPNCKILYYKTELEFVEKVNSESLYSILMSFEKTKYLRIRYKIKKVFCTRKIHFHLDLPIEIINEHSFYLEDIHARKWRCFLSKEEPFKHFTANEVS